MLYAELNVLNFLIILILSYFVGLFWSWFIHYIQHQKVFNIPFYLPHWDDHHLKADNPDEFQKKFGLNYKIKFQVAIIGHGMWVLLALCAILLHFIVFTFWIAITLNTMLSMIAIFHWYLHQTTHRMPDTQFQMSDTQSRWLHWLDRERRFHRVHHLTSTSGDFANARNYAFGDPFSKHLIDYLFGTLEATTSKQEFGFVQNAAKLARVRIRSQHEQG